MSIPGVLYSSKDKTLSHEDRWDDTLLIKQYEAAEARVKKKLQKRISGNTTTATESEQSESLGQDDITTSGNIIPLQAKISKKKKRKRNKKTNVQWHTGDSCCAKYTEDGITYEATVIAMHPTGNCTVRFVGYNNEEELSVNKLKKSNGATARRKQEEEADIENEYTRESDIASSICDSDAQSDTDDKSSKARRRPPSQHAAPSSMMPPPPPSMGAGGRMFGAPPHLPHLPPPPALALGLGGDDPEAAEALHTMLMSWYMTGYHTGYYQGLQHVKPRRK